MTSHPLNRGVLTENFSGIGPVTRELVRARARDLALIAGRVPLRVTLGDPARAEQELAGGPGWDGRGEELELIPESDRVAAVAEPMADEDEDGDGRSETAQLVDEGLLEAERDTMVQAARAAAWRRDGRS